MGKKVIIVGGTIAREHALAWKLSQSTKVERVYIAPGNGGTAQVGENVPISPDDKNKLIEFCKKNSVDLVVISTDDLLADGLADDFRANGFAVFGSSKKASRIECSKAFAKDLMAKQNIPTGAYKNFSNRDQAVAYARGQNYPLVVKASGLALGKGVIICQNFDEAEKAIDLIMSEKAFKSAGDTIVIEEFLKGTEISFHALSDGKDYTLFPVSQDHKQIFDGDKGPNTGGMGAFAPVSWVRDDLTETVKNVVIDPALEGLKEENSIFSGCLYPGLMLTDDGIKVLEYNARLGDPETEIYMRLLDSDLFDLLYSCATGALKPETVKWKSGFAITVVLASKGYPESSQKGIEITGLEEAAAMRDIILFHAGTKMENGKVVTAGGRVMNVTAIGSTLEEAMEKAYAAVDKIHFEGMQYRKDIGRRPVPDFI